MYRDDPPQWQPASTPSRPPARPTGRLTGTQRAVILGALTIVAVLVVAFVVVLAAYPTNDTGSATQAASSQATATGSATKKPKPTHAPVNGLATATPGQSALASPAVLANVCHFTQDQISQVAQIGDLAFSQMNDGPLTYPGVMLPGGLPINKPFQVTTGINPLYGKTTYVQANPSNSAWGMFAMTICNTSASASHTLNHMYMQIALMTPATGTADVWASCDSSYSSRTRQGGVGGCGGAVAGNPDEFTATWPAQVGPGTIVRMPETGVEQDPLQATPTYGAFPVRLKPGATITLGLGMNPLPDGEYSFYPGVSIDNGAPAFPSVPSVPVFFAAHFQVWGGAGCMKNTSMQAQIPKSGAETWWVCPESQK